MVPAPWVNHITDLLYYLDTYFTTGQTSFPQYQFNIEYGPYVQGSKLQVNIKVSVPSLVRSFLGIDIDSICQQVISASTTFRTLSLISRPGPSQMCHFYLVGKLHVMCCVWHPGYAFLCEMVNTSKKTTLLHHQINPVLSSVTI